MQTENLAATPDKKSYISIVFCVLFVLICGLPGLGMGMVLFYLPLLIWFPYSIYKTIKIPASRKSQLIKMLIWIVAIIYVFVLHEYYQKQARANADKVVAKVEQYVTKKKSTLPMPNCLELIA
jgi:energy-coupling factor transporter transmembrane protein EcfT